MNNVSNSDAFHAKKPPFVHQITNSPTAMQGPLPLHSSNSHDPYAAGRTTPSGPRSET
jgi:hypothetical protein